MDLRQLLHIAGVLLIACLLPGCSSDGGSDSNPGNETVSLELVGASEVPPVDTAATGSGSVSIIRETRQISGSVTINGLSSAFAGAHIHTGFAGVNGPVLIELTQNATDPSRLDIPSTTLTDDEMALLLSGGMYVNVHSTNFSDGEIRSQIAPAGITVVRTVLSGDFEVPPVATAGAGIGYATVDTASGDVVANIRVSNVPDANAAHIHQAFAGLEGGVIVPLTRNVTTPELWEASATLPADQLAAFELGQLYFNVHTPDNPDGEIRGQIVPEDVVVVRTLLEGAQEVPPVVTAASGIGYSTVNTSTGDVVANIRTSDIAGQNAAHIHQAARGQNGGVIVPLTRPDAVGSPELWTANSTFSDAQLAAYLADETYFNVHTATNPDGEIRGQIIVP